jgi:hypothetical protein
MHNRQKAGIPEPLPADVSPTTARVVGVVYLTSCAAVGGAGLLYWYPASRYSWIALVLGTIAGLTAALIARLNDPCARPIRWGLLWLVLGTAAGPGLVYGFFYLCYEVLGI